MKNLNHFLQNKKILFFSVQTFNLEKEIKLKLEELGADVIYFDERPRNSILIKGLIRLNRKLIQKTIDKYFQGLLLECNKFKFDYLFVNRGEVIPEFFLIDFKKKQPDCKLIFYTWDSFSNHPHPKKILKYFDKILTFDPSDAIEFNISFRPLFFLDKFKNVSRNIFTYDILFLGTAHTDRYTISSFVKKWAQQNGFKFYGYYYIQSRVVYFYKYFFDRSFRKFKYSDLKFNSLSIDEIINLYEKSNIILDINHPNQLGLTMRTFEALGAKRKLITTNLHVKKYPFYNTKNILVINRENIIIEKAFFVDKYEEIENSVYNKFTIEEWLYNIFIDDEQNYWLKYL